MAFRFVLGRAGSGKTDYCLQAIKNELLVRPEGPPLIWLVPEQATFQAEYALVSSPELGGTLRAQALSFRRLAWRVMQETGGTARLPIDETGKKLLIHRIIHKNREKLRLFGASAEQMGFLDHVNQLFSEWKRYCVTAEELGALAGEQGRRLPITGPLDDKLHDLRVVYLDFEQELSRLYLDGEDYLTLLASQIEHSAYVRDADIWIDGFHGFTPQEFAVLEKLSRHSRSVTMTLCLDREYGAGEELHELDLFHPAARTMKRMDQLLAEAGVERLPTVELNADPPARFRHNPALAFLEKEWERRVKRPYPGDAADGSAPLRGVHLTAAANRRSEVEAAARDILRLVRDEGLRWRDIAVSVRNIEAYGDLLAVTFTEYGIPHFFDQKRSVLGHPLIELIRSALEAVCGQWSYDAVFRCVKTDFFLPNGKEEADGDVRIDRHAMDQLENYVLAFGIRGSKWTEREDWIYTYQSDLESAEGKGSAADSLWLRTINACRRRVAAPLQKLQQSLGSSRRIRDKTEAVYTLLTELNVPERLEAWSREALQMGRPEKAREHAQVWERVVDVFDQLVELMGEETASNDVFARLVDTGLESIKLGLVPPTLDQVLIGSMDRTRSGQVKHLFVLGVNDGVLPAKIKESGVLTEQEREQLAAAGMPLAEGAKRRLLDEPFLIYCAFCTPQEGLWMSYALADEEGKSLLPSDVIRQMKRMFPKVRERLALGEPSPESALTEQMEYVASPDKALSHLIVRLKQWMKGTPMNGVWWSVYNWYARQPELAGTLSVLLKSLTYANAEAPLRRETSLLLYGDTLEASVSRMERFVSCPFSQFASHGLRLKERRIFRLDAPDIGQLFHAALKTFMDDLERDGADWGALSPQECEQRAAYVIDRLAPRLQGEILLSSKRYGYIARKLKQVIGKAAAMLGAHARRGAFRPIGLEVAFGKGQPIPPMAYRLDNGVRMELRGRIDRIDRADTEQGTWLRVIDYKSSAKPLDLTEVYYGLSLQMLAYLDVVLTHAPVWLGKEAQPAGVLYFHVHNPVLGGKNRLTPEEADAELKKKFKMKGLLVAEPGIVQLMDSGLADTGGRSELLPAALKADGSFYKTSSVATEAQWNTIRRYVRRTIREIGTSMTEGRIDIAPFRIGQETACSRCAFRPVCQFDTQLDGNAYKLLPSLGKEEVWAMMEQKTAHTEQGIVLPHETIGTAAADPLAALRVESPDRSGPGGQRKDPKGGQGL